MRLTRLRLRHFRSYEQLDLDLQPGMNVFVGANGAGKTNLLEAVHTCCLGRSHRTSLDREMIQNGAEGCLIHAQVERQAGRDEVTIRLPQQAKAKKQVQVNGKQVARLGELMGHMTCVMFAPEDMEIAKGGPQERRRFLDMLLAQAIPNYFYAIQYYHGVLKQRNALLRELACGGDARQLDAWDEQLAMAAAPVVRARQEAGEKIARLGRAHYAYLSGGKGETLDVAYEGPLARSDDPQRDLAAMLPKGRAEDLRRGSTAAGPHRDDLDLRLNSVALRAFASQGQIRTAILALRLAQMDILTAAHGEAPLLLLDDVLSELDVSRRARLLASVGTMQTLLTTTDLQGLNNHVQGQVFQVRPGKVEAEG